MAQAGEEVMERDREEKWSGNENGKTDFTASAFCDVDCDVSGFGSPNVT